MREEIASQVRAVCQSGTVLGQEVASHAKFRDLVKIEQVKSLVAQTIFWRENFSQGHHVKNWTVKCISDWFWPEKDEKISKSPGLCFSVQVDPALLEYAESEFPLYLFKVPCKPISYLQQC